MLSPTYIGNNEKNSYSPNPQIVKHKFWFCANDLVRCVMGTKKKHILTMTHSQLLEGLKCESKNKTTEE
jgi:hypothetical protein